MSTVKIESFDAAIHRNHMPEALSPPVPRKVLVVCVGKFRLEFLSLAQLDLAIAYFRNPSGSTRRDSSSGDHWEFQPWQSRLPAGIVNAHNRPRVLAALVAARAEASAHLPSAAA
jgi:hypothetical protein